MLETPSRRRVLLWGTAAAAATLLAEPAFALPRAAKRTVRLLNTHTHEALVLTYWRDGEYRLARHAARPQPHHSASLAARRTSAASM